MWEQRDLSFLVLFLACSVFGGTTSGRMVRLGELDLSHMRQGWGEPVVDQAVTKKPMKIGKETFERGVGTHASSLLHVQLDGQTKRFKAKVGVDAGAGSHGTIRFKMYGDGTLLWKSEVLRGGQGSVPVDVDLKGVKRLVLVVTDAGDQIHYDHANWAEAVFEVKGKDPKACEPPEEKRFILTPKPGPEPKVNGAKVYGVRPGRPFLFRIPTTGERPISFQVEGLPEGLKLDRKKGILSGASPKEKGEYKMRFIAENRHGQDQREFCLKVGNTLALTPPMGWNHWYAHYNRVTDAMMREAADVMVESGMADVGYQYVNIDDCWMNAPKHGDPKRVGPLRDEEGNILPNAHFPDMKALTDYVHSKGLKAGLYTSPGPFTCAGFSGSYQHEEQDARQFAAWGFDFLKYDWCSYGRIAKDKSIPELKKPYIKMGSILKRLDRDIVLNLCQYGMGEVWTWGEEVGGHCWRTAGDLGFELTGYHRVARRNAEFHPNAHPGSWNDPDYLLIGHVGEARGMGEPKPCPLTPNEQYSYMSLWCLMASPLFYSGDMSRLDEFTCNVLCNPEVIGINQDPLGKQGFPAAKAEEAEVWKKELEDGSIAVGLFNLAEIETEVLARWEDLGLQGSHTVRDLWRQRDLGTFEDTFKTSVPRHGVVLIRLKASP